MISEGVINNIIDKYFDQENILTSHQIDSYNDYIENILPKILSQFFPINLTFNSNKIKEISLDIVDVNIETPRYTENNGCNKMMTPNMARLKNLTYSLSVFINFGVNIKIIDHGEEINMPHKIIEDIILTKIPVIVKSKYCNYKSDILKECIFDPGGYGIINGSEKVLISQEKIIPNIIQTYEVPKNNSKYSYISEIRSSSEQTFGITKTISAKITNKPNIYNNQIYISLPHIKEDIPLHIIFRCLGCVNDKEIIYFIIDNNNSSIDENIKKILYNCLLLDREYKTKEESFIYLSKKLVTNNTFNSQTKISYCKNIIEKEYLPHLNNNIEKLYYTGLMVNKLIKCFMKIIPCNDRDSYFNKRIETAGVLLGNLTIQGLSKVVKDIKTQITKEVNSGIWDIKNDYTDILNSINIQKMIKKSYIENILKGAMATGNWGIKNNNNKQGVSQVLNRLTFMSSISHLRRISTPVDSTGKLIPPRKLHSSQWGFICPVETPEGQSVGVVKNLSLMCEISNFISSEIIVEILKDKIIYLEDIDLFEHNKEDYIKILFNGRWIGYTENPKEFIEYFKEKRCENKIHPHSSIYWSFNEYIIYIFTDEGRCLRPLFKNNLNLEDINKLISKNENKTWSIIMIEGLSKYIEYVDACETENCLISMDYKTEDSKYTHLEMKPNLIIGSLASCIPFLNHNQSPRNTYQSAMGKQAIGIHCTNISQRYDTFSHILYYPQKPLVNTDMMKYFNFNSMPNGINAIIAIATYTGYNQEDSVIINQGAIDRGLFNSTFYRTYKSEEEKNQLSGDEDIFCKPDEDRLLFSKYGDYSKLEQNGFVPLNTKVNENDMIIGKVMPLKNNPEYDYRDNSTSIKKNEGGYIDGNYIGINGDGYRFCKVRVRSPRIPEIGDKVSSRHGQKGTVGMTYSQEDMPFSKDGIVPDIIINPHAIPSRMTIAQLLECILGKSCSLLGYQGNGSGFNNTNVHDLIEILENLGFDGTGNETLYNGMTGEQMKTQIFMGPTYYQRLKHMSGDKIHSRAGGPIVAMTRQPAEGRSSHGGLRFGEMERDCMISHGSSYFLKERMLDVSDKYSMYICNCCKLISPGNAEENIFECKKCENYSDFTKVYIPYACKLLIQELMSMSMGPRLLTD